MQMQRGCSRCLGALAHQNGLQPPPSLTKKPFAASKHHSCAIIQVAMTNESPKPDTTTAAAAAAAATPTPTPTPAAAAADTSVSPSRPQEPRTTPRLTPHLPPQITEEAPGELTAVVDELLDSLSTKFASVSSEIFEKIEAMSKRLDAMEASLQGSGSK